MNGRAKASQGEWVGRFGYGHIGNFLETHFGLISEVKKGMDTIFFGSGATESFGAPTLGSCSIGLCFCTHTCTRRSIAAAAAAVAIVKTTKNIFPK